MTSETSLSTSSNPIEYLVIGHVTRDLTPHGAVLGGTVSYAALTAAVLGLNVGMVTSCSEDFHPEQLAAMKKIVIPASETTTFENVYKSKGRIQRIHHRAALLKARHIPALWRNCPLVHLGPVANEIDPSIAELFSSAVIGVTPQGWMRDWDKSGNVHFKQWRDPEKVLQFAGATVLSIEDVQHDENEIERLAQFSKVLVVTEGAAGARVYWNGDVRRIRPPQVEEVDSTGAGDIFATAFFIRFSQTRDPWAAAEFATKLAAESVTRKGVAGIPTTIEIQKNLIEIL